MKILHVVQGSLPVVAGYTIRTKYITENQKLKGLNPVVVTSPTHITESGIPESGFEDIEGIKHYRTDCGIKLDSRDNIILKIYKRFLISKHYKKKLERICKVESPDIIHSHSDYLNGLVAGRVGKKLGIPVVYELRGLWADAAVANAGLSENSLVYKYNYYMNKKTFNLVDHIYCLGEVLKKELLQQGVKEDKISVVHNGVDFKSFSPVAKDMELVKKYNLIDCKVLGFIGSVRKLEGLDLLIDVFPDLIKRYPKVKMMIVGDGDGLDALKKIVADKKLTDTIIITGGVTHKEVSRYYSITDIMVYPRINMKINQKVTPLKPLETMVMEKAILASDVGGLAELVSDGHTGLLFKTENKEDFLKQCLRIVQDDDLRNNLVSNAKEWVKNNRDWEKIVELYDPIYQELLRRV